MIQQSSVANILTWTTHATNTQHAGLGEITVTNIQWTVHRAQCTVKSAQCTVHQPLIFMKCFQSKCCSVLLVESIEVTHYICNIEGGLSNLDSHWQGCLDSLAVVRPLFLSWAEIICEVKSWWWSSNTKILYFSSWGSSQLTAHTSSVCVCCVSYIISSAMERNQGQNIAVEILIIDKLLEVSPTQHDIETMLTARAW